MLVNTRCRIKAVHDNGCSGQAGRKQTIVVKNQFGMIAETPTEGKSLDQRKKHERNLLQTKTLLLKSENKVI